MLSQRRLVLRWIDRQSFPIHVIEFREAMLRAAVQALEMPTMDAEGFADASIHNFWNLLLQKCDRDARRGISSCFDVLDPSSYRLTWKPLILLRSPDRKERIRGLKLASRPKLLETIDGMSAREYEALGCVISRLAGASQTKLTPPGNEGGVDFFALVEQPSRCHLFSGRTGPLRIIGQTKHYGNPAEAGEIRDFITTIENVRRRQPNVERHVPAWFRSANGPVAGWFIAHQGLQEGAERDARDHGIIVSDSLDLAEIAALSRLLNPCVSAGDRAMILYQIVREVLQQTL